MCLSHNAQMLRSSSEVIAKTKLLTQTLDSTRTMMGNELHQLQSSYIQLEEKSNQVKLVQPTGSIYTGGGGPHPQAEIVETTFRSRFRFRFLKYPLLKKVVSFRVPEI